MTPQQPVDGVYPDDFQQFIENLQKIIEDAPPGYQAKFARVIAELQQKKLLKIAEWQFLLHPKAGENVNYEYLLQTLTLAVSDPSSKTSERFEAALKIAQLREEKKEEPPTTPKKEE